MKLPFQLLCISIVFCVIAVLDARAQELTFGQIDQQISTVSEDTALTAELQTEALQALEAARSELESVQRLKTEADAIKGIIDNRETISADIAARRAETDASLLLPEDSDTITELTARLSILDAERSSTTATIDSLRQNQTQLIAKSAVLPEELSKTREALNLLSDPLPSDTEDSVAQARLTLKNAQRQRLEQAQKTIRADLESLQVRKDIVSARLSAAEERLSALNAVITAIQIRLSDTRIGRAEEALEKAKEVLAQIPDGKDELRTFAEENTLLAEKRLLMARSEPDQASRTMMSSSCLHQAGKFKAKCARTCMMVDPKLPTRGMWKSSLSGAKTCEP